MANVFACRSHRHSAFTLGWFNNPLILWGIVTEILLLGLIVYTPVGNKIFGTRPVPLWIFGPLALGATLLLAMEEARKALVHRLNQPASRV